MQIIYKIVSCGAALMLLYAASFKIGSISHLRTTFRSLGLPESTVNVMAPGLVVFELVTGVVLAGFGPQRLAGGLLVVLSVGLFTAGIVALRRYEPIRCSCFSRHATTTLGRRQILLALPLIALAVVLVTGPDLAWSQRALWRLGAICTVGAALHLALMASDLRSLVGYRRAASSEFPA